MHFSPLSDYTFPEPSTAPPGQCAGNASFPEGNGAFASIWDPGSHKGTSYSYWLSHSDSSSATDAAAQECDSLSDTTLAPAAQECLLSEFKQFEFTPLRAEIVASAEEIRKRQSFSTAVSAIAATVQPPSAKGVPKNPKAQFSSVGRPALFRRPARDATTLDAAAKFKEAVHRAKQTA